MTPRKRRSEQDAAPQLAAPKNNGRPAAASVDPNQYFFGESLVGVRPEELSGTLVVVEGMDGSGRSTQIALLQECSSQKASRFRPPACGGPTWSERILMI